MNELDVLDKLANTSSTKDKAKILQDNKDNTRLVDLLEACYNFEHKYYINKFQVPAKPAVVELDHHKMFMDLLGKLEARDIVGNEARASVELFFSYCSERQIKWYSRIIRRDLKAGVSQKSVAEIADFKVFDVQLAKDGKDNKSADKIIKKGVYLSPKFDGYRCIAVIDCGTVTLFSRNGTVFDNFPSIEESLLESFPNQQLILDGEIMSDDFQSMQKSAFASKRGTTVGDVKFHVFDCVDYIEWITDDFVQKKSKRYETLKNLSKSFKSNVVMVQQDLIYDMKDVLAAEQLYISQGFEGAMTCPDIPYYRGKKSNTLMKWKTMVSEDCEIIGFYEGKDDTRHKGRLGGFVLKQEDGKECECGSGFSDEDRDYIYQNQAEFLGRIVEVKYQEKTNHGILRFPVFIRYRDDKK